MIQFQSITYAYDMEKKSVRTYRYLLGRLEKEAYRLEFIVGTNNEHL